MITLAPIFTDHMVLQRNKNVAIWGESDQEKVTVTLGENKVTAIPEQGKFSLVLPPMEQGGPYELKAEGENDQILLKDIMIGEVWFAGGQSNMELELQNSFEGEKELEKVADEKVRYYYVPKKSWVGEELLEAEKESTWECGDKEDSRKWSAVAYYYAKELSRKLNVTVGIIGCNWGGTSASAWMSREMLEESKKTVSYVEEYDKIVENQDFDAYLKEREEYIVYQTAFEEKVSHYYETCPNPSWDEAISLFGENKYPGPMGPYSEFRPSGLYETMVSRVCPYTIAGFIYYQGEEDDHKPTTYYELLCALIRQWRTDWNDDSLPFLLVQLPVFQNEGEPDYKNWPLIREAQMRIFQTVKNTGIAVILENGEYGNIHPTKKEAVGKRLALQAFAHIYKLIPCKEAFGPVYRASHVENANMILEFDYCDGFTCTREVTGFELAGKDKVYYPAEYEIQGDKIVLHTSQVAKPVYARYCWTNYAQIGLFGKNLLPVAPFRTNRNDGSCVTGSRLSNEGVM